MRQGEPLVSGKGTQNVKIFTQNHTKTIIKIIDRSRVKGLSEEQIKNNLISENKAYKAKVNNKQAGKDLEP